MLLIKSPSSEQHFQVARTCSIELMLQMLNSNFNISDADTVIWMSPTGNTPWTALSTDSWRKTILESASVHTLYVRGAVPEDWESGSEDEGSRRVPVTISQDTDLERQKRACSHSQGGAQGGKAVGKRARGGKKGGGGGPGKKCGGAAPATRRSTRGSKPSEKVIDNEEFARNLADTTTIQKATRARKVEAKRLIDDFPFG
jgi:hypothetical protein